MTGIRAYLVGVAPLSRDGLTAVLEAGGIQVVGYGTATAEQPPAPPQFDVAIVDCSALPHDVRETLLEELRGRFSATNVVGLIEADDLAGLDMCIAKKFDGAVPKTISGPVFIKVLQVITAGERYFPASMVPTHIAKDSYAGGGADRVPSGTEVSLLSLRERQILRHLAAGKSNKAIASTLDCTEATIKAHMKRILRKISANNRTQAAVWALSHGMTSSDEWTATDPVDDGHDFQAH